MTNSLETRRKRAQIGTLTAGSNDKKGNQPNIDYTRKEISSMENKWTLIEDCLKGQNAIKEAATKYLPMPNSNDRSEENLARYDAYLQRAVFYNVTRRTLEGLVGQVFSRDPLINLPENMKSMIDNVDGEGVSLDQQAKKGLAYTLAFGSFGLLVDYPKTDGKVSLADQQKGFIRPTLTLYHRRSIINWRYQKRGAEMIYSLVVIKEEGAISDDGFEINNELQWRVLQLVDNIYVMTLWRYNDETNAYEIKEDSLRPIDGDGNHLDHIPFYFCGCFDNNAAPDEPPIYDLAELNIAHYRNSADYEDSCYLVGQPTPVFSGLTKQWVNDVFKNKPIQLGSRGSVALPVGGTAMLLQANANSMPKEAMDQKESQMVALGGKLFTPGQGRNTLGEAQLDESAETSMLSTAAKNVSLTYTLALREAAAMHATAKTDVEYSLNTDFPASRLTPNERTQTVLEWQAGAITMPEMRATLRKAGIATLDLEEYKKEIAANPPPQPKTMTNNGDKGGSDNEPKKNKDAENNGGNQSKV